MILLASGLIAGRCGHGRGRSGRQRARLSIESRRTSSWFMGTWSPSTGPKRSSKTAPSSSGPTHRGGGPAAIASHYRAPKTLDAGGDFVMPGMVNAHTHASMTVFRGLGDDVPDRLTRFIFPLEHTLVDREVVYWGALHGMVEMVQGGVTTLADMYYFEDEVARAAQKIGVRGVLGETVLDAPAPDAKEPYGGIDYAEKFIKALRGDRLITPGVRAACPLYRRCCPPQNHRNGGPMPSTCRLLMHVAETADEVATLKKRFDMTPVGVPGLPRGAQRSPGGGALHISSTMPISPC